MSCTTCGSNVPCGCSSTTTACVYCYQAGCSGGCQSSSNRLCGNVVPAAPQPYYTCAPSCQESNTQKIIVNQFAAALKVVNSWNVPACGLSATLSIPGLINVTIGSYLWNATYGYFEITAFDSGLQQVTVVNNCNEGNAVAGTAVPACTDFLNAAPPAVDDNTGTPCVAIDFTAPAVSACIDITLNNTTGVLAGDVVQIGSGFYRVAEVKPNDIINICNDGDGITPGTSVIALDASGNFNYCLQIISTSPCDRDVVENAAVVVCNTEGQTTTIHMPEDAWILEGTLAQGTNFVGAIPLGLPPFCTRLTAPLNIVASTASMALVVSDTSGYLSGDILQIAGYQNTAGIPNYRLTVTSVADSTHVTGTMDPVPPASVTIPTNTVVCRIGCCELLQNQLDAIVQTFSTGETTLGTTTLATGNQTFNSSYQNFVLVNNSNQFDMSVVGTFVGSSDIFALVSGTVTDVEIIEDQLQITINAGGPTTLNRVFHSYRLSAVERIQVSAVNIPITTVAPGATVTIGIRHSFIWNNTSLAGSTCLVSGCYVQGILIGLPTL